MQHARYIAIFMEKRYFVPNEFSLFGTIFVPHKLNLLGTISRLLPLSEMV